LIQFRLKKLTSCVHETLGDMGYICPISRFSNTLSDCHEASPQVL
jgi:hypothetical protein